MSALKSFCKIEISHVDFRDPKSVVKNAAHGGRTGGKYRPEPSERFPPQAAVRPSWH